MNLLYIQFKK